MHPFNDYLSDVSVKMCRPVKFPGTVTIFAGTFYANTKYALGSGKA